MKKALALILCLLTVSASFSFSFSSFALENSSLQNGETFELGSYPQSEVTSSFLKAALSSQRGEWVSYGYYAGYGKDNGQMAPDDYMKYKIVSYNGEKYIAVRFDTYRGDYTGYPSVTKKDYSFQPENGYYYLSTYWFKFEPLEWEVVDADRGLVLCKTIVDAQAFNNVIKKEGNDYYSGGYYANNWAKSSLRQWLGSFFYDTAFTSEEKEFIGTVTLDNTSANTAIRKYDAESTQDNIFLLSYLDATNLTASSLKATGSDYALCQGLMAKDNGNSYWYLRTTGSDCDGVYYVNDEGKAFAYANPGRTYVGIRPAFIIAQDAPVPTLVSIKNYKQELEGKYRATIVLSPANNLPLDSKVEWFVNGSLYSTGRVFRLEDVREDFSVYFIATLADGTSLTSETEQVSIPTGVFSGIRAFFQWLFTCLPVITN